MKKIYFLFLTVLFAAFTNAQSTANYAFATSTTGSLALDLNANVVDMATGTTTISGSSVDQGVGGSAITIGFDFWLMGNRYTQFNVTTNGLVSLSNTGTSASGSTYVVSGGTITTPVISAFAADLGTGTSGKTHYKIVGTAPNRCLVAEFNNMTLLWTSAYTNDGTYQVRLYETTGVIEFVYGNMSITSTASASDATVAIGFATNTTANNLAWITSATNANAVTAPFTDNPTYSTGAIINLNSAANGSRRTYQYTSPVPAAPTAISFTSVGASTMTLNWTDNATNEAGYAIYRSTDGIIYNFVSQAAANATSSAQGGLSPLTNYFWRVYAVTEGALSIALSGSQSTTACVGIPAGTYSVGPTGTYPSLTAVAAALSAGTAGPVIFELQPAYLSAVETFPIVFSATTCPIASVTIRPNVAVASTLNITGSNTTAIIDFNGGTNITFDGRPGGAGTNRFLTISNTSTATGGSAIRFINEGSNNTVKYCVLKSLFPSTTSGVVVFSTTTGANGNDNNAIDNCDIDGGAAAAVSPTLNATNGIYSAGTTTTTVANNSGNTVSNCNIFNYFVASQTSIGINLQSGNENWTVSNNRIYQTSARTFTGTVLRYSGITINSTSGTFNVTGNTIGFATSAGTGVTSISGSTNTLRGIDGTGVNGTAVTNFQGNTISGISQSTASTGTGTASPFIAIGAISGRFNVGNSTGNTIGSLDGSSTITITTTGTGAGLVVGVYDFSVNSNTISNNNFGAITIGGAGTSVGFRGIFVNTTATATETIQNNTIGGTVPAGAITSSQVGSYAMYGIQTSLPAVNMTGNVVRNITGNANGAVVVMTGYTVTAGTATSPSTISGNTVHSLNNIVTGGAAGALYCFDLTMPALANVVERNLVHSISVSSTFATYQLFGIVMRGQGVATFKNNMIRLGLNSAGASLTTGFSIVGFRDIAGATSNYYNNSVYIGGTGVVSVSNTYCLLSDVVNNTRNFQNNIFWNARSNASGGIGNVAIRVGGTTANPPGLTSNNNDLFANGTDGVVGVFNGLIYPTLAAWRTVTGQDGSSFSADPQYILPNGDAATGDLHIHATNPTPIEAAGVPIAAVVDDFDSQTRATLTPTDVGADAGNFVLSDIAPPAIVYTVLPVTCSTGDRTLSGVNIIDATGVPTTGTLRPRIYYKKNAGGYFSQPGTLTSGTGTNGQWSFAILTSDIGPLAVGDIISYYIIAQDLAGTPNIGSNPGGVIATDVNTVTTHPAAPNTYVIAATLNGTYTVGAGGNYITLTAAVAAYNIACLTGPVVFSLTDATYPGETFPITINANANASAANTLTIKPATGVNASISGSSASAIIILNGADYVTINGSNANTPNTVCPVSAASRDLTITNTNTGTASAGVWMQWLFVNAVPKSATNNAVINCNIVGNSNTTTLVGVGSGSSTIATTTLGYLNNNNSFINNNISKTQYGLISIGQSAVDKNSGTIINQNLVNTVAPNNTARGGILGGFENNITISGNNISEIALASSPDVFGIALGGIAITTTGFTGNEVTNAVITKNIIGSVRNTGNSFSACGIFVATATSGTNLIANNMISGVSGNPTPGDLSVGMLLGGGTGSATQVYDNTITMTNVNPLTLSTSPSYALAIGGANPVVDIRNNILVNTQNNGTGNNYAIGYGYTPFTNLTSDHNDYYVAAGATFFVGATGSLSAPANQQTVANLQAATLKDGIAQNVLPVFISPTNLHLSTAAGINWCLNGTGIAVSVTDDIDCEVRSNPQDIGADEFVATGFVVNNPAPVCAPATVDLTAPAVTAGSIGGLTFTYFTDAAGTILLATPAAVAVSGTYYIKASNGTCTMILPVVVVINPINTITLTSAPPTTSQTVCINTAITNITYSTTSATGATFSGLPAGVNGAWAANIVTISGSPSVSGSFNYTVTLTGGCGTITATGSITVTPNNTITLTSAPGTNAQTVCINTLITNITYSTTGATGASFAGLPAGVSGAWAANTVTISGTPTASGIFNYTVTLTGGCGTITANGSITVSANNTITLTSAPGTDAQTICINTAITNITYATAGATGANFTGLPAGVSGSWAGNVVTISGTPNITGIFNYTVTLTGGCGAVTVSGLITVTPNNTITLTSAPGTDAQTVCINSPIANITYSTAGATGASFSGLPAGVSGVWAANVVTISGTPTASGTLNYTVTLTGGCGTITANGSITVTANNTVTLTSAPGTDAQTVCMNTAITNITYSTTGATGASFSGLPAGVTGAWAANVITISGTASVSGLFNYTVTLTGGCGIISATGTININPVPVISSTQVEPSTCVSPDGSIDITVTGAAGPYTYLWTGSGVIPANEDQINLTVGSYSVTVTAGNGCTATANFALSGPGGCSICPTIGSFVSSPSGASCTGNPITLTASGLTDMGTTYGITFKQSSIILANPYTGGTVIATVPNAGLTSGGTVAITTTTLPAGSYYLYAILSPAPIDPACRPAIQISLTVNPTPDVNQPANQAVCNNTATAPVNFTGSVPGTIFTWTNSDPSIGLEASGTGDIASFTATNATASPVVATITVTPTFGASAVTATFNYTGAIQTWTVPAGVTSVNLDALGAQGGSVTVSCTATGGLGARMQGDFAVTPGEVLSIMVGQQGLSNGSDAGGGGGTFIVRGASTPLLISGGGGGATNNIGNCGSNRNGVDATITTSGTASGNGAVAGGTGGNGGGASNGSGGGGGGFLTNGVAGTGLANNNGKSYLNGGIGGTGNNSDNGGYGGGGAGWFTGGNGGGGGGYSGGGTSGAQPFTGGGGGGSFNSGANQVNTAAAGTGNGQVIITYSAGPACTGTPKTFPITVNPTPSATISYAGSPYCSNAGTATVTQTGTTGGTYSSTAGLTINATTGAVTLGTSTAGTYTVTYTIAAAGGCATFTTTASIIITALPAATIAYTGSPYCQNAGTATVTRTGTAGGTYSSTAGLAIDATTGDVTLGTSIPGTYTVTYTIAASGGCPAVTATASITITAVPAATIVYSGSPYCQNAGTATVTQTGTTGGTYSSTAGLTINATTGDVTLGTSTPGTYTVTYIIAPAGGCLAFTTTTTITITAAPAATIVYTGSPYCQNAGTANVTRTGTAGGTYSSTAGLSINAITGAVTLGTSTPGTYTVTYTIAAAGGCPAVTVTTTITITATPAATIVYAGSPYCSTDLTAPVTRTGTAGGTYSSTAGLTINAATGTVTPNTSTPGTYTVTYSVAAGGGCAAYSTTTTITINQAPNAIIFYAGTPYCQNGGTATVTRTGTAGGTYSSTAGLTINATTGAVTLGTSTPGTYTVTYTIPASGGCGVYITTTTITINAAPSATIAYTGSPYCANAGTATVTQTGTAGGTYSSTTGLTINATTGAVTLATSTPGTYTVTYTIAASAGCAAFTTTATITITALPAATISYTGSPYCQNAGTATVTRTGTAGGTYSSTAGLSINATTGDVNLAASTAGTYTVTYTMAAGGGCPVVTTTTTITINTLPAATISYAGNPYCQNAGTATVTRTGTAGGTYSSTAGLIINATTGTVTLATSTPGTYAVTYTIAAGGGCPAVTATTTITVSSLSVAPTGATVSPSAICGPGTVTLTVTGGTLGTGATWRWYTASCGGTAVGTGATLTVTASATTTYFVRAEGACNTTTCASVTVTVNVQPTISIAASPRTTLLPGQTTTLTATVTPADPTSTTVWFRNGNPVPGATGLTLVVGVDQLGLYTAMTTTTNGCTALSNAVLIGDSPSNTLFITPNPNHGRFQVRYYAGAPLGFRHLIMFAENGQKVYDKVYGMTAPYSSMDVDATRMAKGIYIVMLTDASGKVLATRKVVIQ